MQQREVGRVTGDRRLELIAVEHARLDCAVELQCLKPLRPARSDAQGCLTSVNGQFRRVEISAGEECRWVSLRPSVREQRCLEELVSILGVIRNFHSRSMVVSVFTPFNEYLRSFTAASPKAFIAVSVAQEFFCAYTEVVEATDKAATTGGLPLNVRHCRATREGKFMILSLAPAAA